MRRDNPTGPATGTAAAVVMPGVQPGEWLLCRPLAAVDPAAPLPLPGHASAEGTRQTFASLDALAANLEPAEPVVLTLPLELGLVQRLVLPPAEPDELREMVTIQLEKILPYAVDNVAVAIQEIVRTDAEVVAVVETVPHERLLTLCQPLTTRGCYPVRTLFFARAVSAGAPAGDVSALVYQAGERYVLGVCEGGKISFAQGLGGREPEELAAELPAVLLGAELEGIPTNFSVLRLDERCASLGEVFRAALGVPVETFDAEGAAALAGAAGANEAGDLSPPGWRAERVRSERQGRLRRRIVLGVGIYLGALVLAFALLGILRLRVGWQRSQLARLKPKSEYAQKADARWTALSPAVEPARSLAETFYQVYGCLPADSSVLLTAYDQTPTTVQIQGEAPAAAQVDDFMEKLRALRGQLPYEWKPEPNVILPNGHAKFRVNGTLRSLGGPPP